MAVQVWIGDKPEHPNERRAIVALANGLERLENLYLLLANFHVGGRTIDMVIIKQDAIFIVELKHCDGKLFGSVNGPWYVESAGGSRKRLNPGRKNPYNQVISYYYSLTNFLNDNSSEIYERHKSEHSSFRSCRRVIVVAPRIEPGSELDIDWKVEIKGLDDLPAFLVTERSPELNLSEEEMLAIPELLGCTRWHDITTLMTGVLPQWKAEPEAPAAPPAPPEPVPAAPVVAPPVPWWQRARTALGQSLTPLMGAAALLMSTVALVLLVVILNRPPLASPAPTAAPISLRPSGPAAGGVFPELAPSSATRQCVWAGFQSVGKHWDAQNQRWISVGVSGAVTEIFPEVVVTLEKVNFCEGQIRLHWSVRNNSSQPVVFPLSNGNITIRDPMGNAYQLDDTLSQPYSMTVAPDSSQPGVAVVNRPVSQNAPSLLVRIKNQPFGEASWLVSLEED